MKRLLLSAMQSGSGKTIVTCGLLAALQNRGLQVQAFKCGPDYIDPMFHTRILKVPSRNLDLFLQGEQGIYRTLSRHTGEIALLEGAMGFYDGVGNTDWASAWQIATLTKTPVLLIVRPCGTSLTLAAQIKGLLAFRPDTCIVGLLLNDCKSSMYAHLAPLLQQETGLPVLGYLPPMKEAVLESRHLGLITAKEVQDISERFARIGEAIEKTVDLDQLLQLAEQATPLPVSSQSVVHTSDCCRIAVARDEAFCFYYQDSLDALCAAGATLFPFSPLHDAFLPEEIGGLYLGGGYPELWAQELSQNEGMRNSIRQAIESGIPTVAECGGFLYLQHSLQDQNGVAWPMVNALRGDGRKTERLQRFGYLYLTAETDSLLFRQGETVPAHEFHYWDSTENGAGLTAKKPLRDRNWRCGIVGPTVYAAFPHLHFGGAIPLAARFVAAATAFQEGAK